MYLLHKLTALKYAPSYLLADLLIKKLSSRNINDISEAINYLDHTKWEQKDFEKTMRKILYYLLKNKRQEFKLLLEKITELSSLEFTYSILYYASGSEFGPLADFVNAWDHDYARQRYHTNAG